MKLFPRMELAVKALALCCENKDDGKTRCGDAEKSPIARSEVFNETWMLRLTLAAIHDYGEGFCHLDGKKNDALKRIQEAVQKRWISEGGLEPAFEKEGTTWTDAILGNVRLKGESGDNNKKKDTASNKRKVEFADTPNNKPSVIIVEAKMGSPLDKSVTNSTDYDQAARNIACLAKLLNEGTKNAKALAVESAFIVFAPETKIEEWEADNNKADNNPHTMIRNAWSTIEKQQEERKRDSKRGGIINARESAVERIGDLESLVQSICHNSNVISWEDIIQSMKNDKSGACEILKWFYVKTCKEYGIKVGELK